MATAKSLEIIESLGESAGLPRLSAGRAPQNAKLFCTINGDEAFLTRIKISKGSRRLVALCEAGSGSLQRRRQTRPDPDRLAHPVSRTGHDAPQQFGRGRRRPLEQPGSPD